MKAANPTTGRSSFGLSQFDSPAKRRQRASRAGLAAIAVAALSTTASATLNIYEPFNYSAGQLQGNTNASAGTSANGLAWLQAGTGNPPPGINVTAGSLTGPAALPPPVGNQLAITHQTANDGSTNRLAFGASTSSSYTSGTVYYSFLLNVSSLANSNTGAGAFFLSLNNTGNSSHTAMDARMLMHGAAEDGRTP